jgi:hypothetical protein
MIMFLFVLYIINGLILAIWSYRDAFRGGIKYLEEECEATILQKIFFIILLIGTILLVTFIWPAWAVITICERNMN